MTIIQTALVVLPFWLTTLGWTVNRLKQAGEPMKRVAVVIAVLAALAGLALSGCFGPDCGSTIASFDACSTPVVQPAQPSAYQVQMDTWAYECDTGQHPAACINYQNQLANERQYNADYNEAVRAQQAAIWQAWEVQRLQWSIQQQNRWSNQW